MHNKTLLFIYPMHGSELAVKLNSAITLKEPSILSIGIFWSATTGFQLSGCSTIMAFLTNRDQWFVPPTSMDPLAEFKQLFATVINEYTLDSSQIKMCFEANYTVAGQHYFTPLVIDLLNFIKPSAVILPSETLECRQFANYWMDQNDYPRLSMGEKFEVVQDHYEFSKLTDDEKDNIDRLSKSARMQLTFSPPPKFLTVSKGLCGAAVKILKTNSMAEVQQQLGYAHLETESVLTLDWASAASSPVVEYPVVSTPMSHSSDGSQPVTPSSLIGAEYQVVPILASHSSDSSQSVTPLSLVDAGPEVVCPSSVGHAPSQQINYHSSKVLPATQETYNDSDHATGSPGADIKEPQSTQSTSFLYRFFCRACCTGNAADVLSQSEKYNDGTDGAPLPVY